MTLLPITDEDYNYVQDLVCLLGQRKGVNENDALTLLDEFLSSPSPDMNTTLFIWEALYQKECMDSTEGIENLKESARSQFRHLNNNPLFQ